MRVTTSWLWFPSPTHAACNSTSSEDDIPLESMKPRGGRASWCVEKRRSRRKRSSRRNGLTGGTEKRRTNESSTAHLLRILCKDCLRSSSVPPCLLLFRFLRNLRYLEHPD